jgi:4-amino-4-deoxy-L-arabinose transferase-like glycosyltransferase
VEDNRKSLRRASFSVHDKAALLIILTTTVLRLAVSAFSGFGNDEAYTLAISRRLDLSYFDHPPLHQWIAYVSMQLFGDGAAVRLPFIAMAAVASWFVYRTTRHLFGAQAGVWGLVGLNSAGFFFLSAGSWVVPDGPLLLCLAGAADVLARLFFPGNGCVPSPWRSWLAAGVWIGLAGLSKYTAVFFPVGVFLFLCLSREHRAWLRHPAPYVASIVALALVTPVLIWNADNHWVSFAFQTGRGAPLPKLHPAHVLAMVAGQALFLCPWVFAPLFAALVWAFRTSKANDPRRFLLWLALPAIVLFTIVPLWGQRGLPHWTMPGWFFVFPLLGAWVAQAHSLWFSKRAWARWSAGLTLATAVLFVTQARTGWVETLAPSLQGKGDPTLESFDWTALRGAAALQKTADWAPGFVVTTKWITGGKIDQALNGDPPVVVFSPDPRGFAFAHDPAEFVGKDALIVLNTKNAREELADLAQYFELFDTPEIFTIGRSGMAETTLITVKAHRLMRPYPLPYFRNRQLGQKLLTSLDPR